MMLHNAVAVVANPFAENVMPNKKKKIRRQDLTALSRELIRLLQDINFGSIECLHVHRGEPVWTPPPRITRELKFGAPSGPRPETRLEDFALKAEVVELLERIETMQDGVIDRIEVRHGLPFRMIIVENAAA